jgi:hypothetical protein
MDELPDENDRTDDEEPCDVETSDSVCHTDPRSTARATGSKTEARQEQLRAHQ